MTTEAEIFRIRAGVAKVRRANGTLLVSPADGRALRISTVGEELLPLLAEGAPRDELVAHLRGRHPTALDVGTKLGRFLAQLADMGLLDKTVAAPRRVPARYPMFDPDPAAKRVADLIARIPSAVSWGLLAALSLGAVGSLLALILAGALPHPLDLFRKFSLLGFALFALAVVPIHESAHALACRLAGARVGKAGIILHGWVMPGPYVDTSHAYAIGSRGKRAWIPAAGPLVDLLGLGAAAAWLLAVGPEGVGADAARTLFLLCSAFLILDTNPIGPSDGSRVIEALLDDELLRTSALSKRARLSSLRDVALYRIACSVHVQAVAVLGYFWWTAAQGKL